ncbi:MAG: hypothetical protein ACLQGP_32055 [Isosphaeraceae bacterium]
MAIPSFPQWEETPAAKIGIDGAQATDTMEKINLDWSTWPRQIRTMFRTVLMDGTAARIGKRASGSILNEMSDGSWTLFVA